LIVVVILCDTHIAHTLWFLSLTHEERKVVEWKLCPHTMVLDTLLLEATSALIQTVSENQSCLGFLQCLEEFSCPRKNSHCVAWSCANPDAEFWAKGGWWTVQPELVTQNKMMRNSLYAMTAVCLCNVLIKTEIPSDCQASHGWLLNCCTSAFYHWHDGFLCWFCCKRENNVLFLYLLVWGHGLLVRSPFFGNSKCLTLLYVIQAL